MDDVAHGHSSAPPEVRLYWRPGCGFCARLMRELDVLGIPAQRHNIWEDEEAAAFVRSVAGGNETVPTVLVGDQAMVNPRGQDVVGAMRRKHATGRSPMAAPEVA